MIKELETNSVEETEAIGRKLGGRLKGGEVIELSSDLGGGKTALVRGLAAGAGSSDRVASPTFTVSKVYKTPQFEIHHFDFYRLNDPGIIQHEIGETIDSKTDVAVIEWAESVKHILPASTLRIRIDVGTDNNSRKISLDIPESLDYLVEEL